MRAFPSRMLTILAALVVLAVTTLSASTVSQFNLAEMSRRAQKIYVGTVRSATEGTLAVGGGQLAVVTYRLTVDEDLLGETAMVKGERVAEIRMLGKQKAVQVGSLRSVSPAAGHACSDGGSDLSRLHDATERRRLVDDGRPWSGLLQVVRQGRQPDGRQRGQQRRALPRHAAGCGSRSRVALGGAASRRTDAICGPSRADHQPRRSQEVGSSCTRDIPSWLSAPSLPSC